MEILRTVLHHQLVVVIVQECAPHTKVKKRVKETNRDNSTELSTPLVINGKPLGKI